MDMDEDEERISCYKNLLRIRTCLVIRSIEAKQKHMLKVTSFFFLFFYFLYLYLKPRIMEKHAYQTMQINPIKFASTKERRLIA